MFEVDAYGDLVTSAGQRTGQVQRLNLRAANHQTRNGNDDFLQIVPWTHDGGIDGRSIVEAFLVDRQRLPWHIAPTRTATPAGG